MIGGHLRWIPRKLVPKVNMVALGWPAVDETIEVFGSIVEMRAYSDMSWPIVKDDIFLRQFCYNPFRVI